ncbi:MAG: hypothetical protein JWQ38_769 [Flavipsychrobacter sp.]|nr:hypothetical protein [Flavipsychrobacter sp.]
MKRNAGKYLILISCSVFLFSFKGQVHKTKNRQTSCDSCFKHIGAFFGQRFGDILLTTTKNNSFLKYRYYEDGKVIFSCGKDQIEYFIDTVECYAINQKQEIYYDGEDILILTQKTGSDTWLNSFLFTNVHHIPVRSQAICIDTISYRYVDLKETKNETYFVVHDLIQGDKYSIRSNYSRYYDGDPTLHIFNVHLENDTISYSIRTKGRIVNDVIYRK